MSLHIYSLTFLLLMIAFVKLLKSYLTFSLLSLYSSNNPLQENYDMNVRSEISYHYYIFYIQALLECGFKQLKVHNLEATIVSLFVRYKTDLWCNRYFKYDDIDATLSLQWNLKLRIMLASFHFCLILLLWRLLLFRDMEV